MDATEIILGGDSRHYSGDAASGSDSSLCSENDDFYDSESSRGSRSRGRKGRERQRCDDDYETSDSEDSQETDVYGPGPVHRHNVANETFLEERRIQIRIVPSLVIM